MVDVVFSPFFPKSLSFSLIIDTSWQLFLQSSASFCVNISPALTYQMPSVNEWSYLKASMSRSTFWASPWTRMWFWNFLSASSSSMLWKSISSTTQLYQQGDRRREKQFCYVLQGSAGVESIVEDISVFIKEDITRDYLFSFIKFTIAVALMLWNTRFFFCLLWNVHMVNDPLLQYIYTQFNHLDFSSGFI